MSVDLAAARGELEQKKGSLSISMTELGSAQMQLNSAASEDEKNNLKSTIDGLKQKVTIEILDVNEASAGLRSAELGEQKEHLRIEEQERDKEIKEQEKAKAQEDKEKDHTEIKEPQAKTKKDKVSVGGEDFNLSEKTINEKKDPALIQAELLKQIQEIAGKSDIEEKAPVVANKAAETVITNNPADPNISPGISSAGDAKTEKSPMIKSAAGASSANT